MNKKYVLHTDSMGRHQILDENEVVGFSLNPFATSLSPDPNRGKTVEGKTVDGITQEFAFTNNWKTWIITVPPENLTNENKDMIFEPNSVNGESIVAKKVLYQKTGKDVTDQVKKRT